MEGMQAFAKRHFPALDRETTEFVCLECVGSPYLCVVEGEGMLRMRHYTAETRERLARAGLDAGVGLTRGLRTVAATDGLIALRAGYPTCTARWRRRDQVPGQLPLALGHAGQPRLGQRRGSAGGLRGVRARPCGRPSSSRSTAPPGPNSGRSRMPSRVRHLEKLSSMASISSRMKRGDRFTRDTTTPGTSPSSTSWSTRANVIVNS